LPRLPTNRNDAMRQSICYYGVPLAVILSVGIYGRAFGFSISSFLDPMFAFLLVVSLLVGVGAGALFGLVMWRMIQRMTGHDK
jgi:hypothetical protein